MRRSSSALAAHEGVEKAGQAAAEIALDEGAALGPLHVLPAHQGGDGGVLGFDHATVGKALDDGVGGGFLPAQLVGAQMHQLAALHRLVLPEDLAEFQLAVEYLGGVHRIFLLWSNAVDLGCSLTH